MQETVLKCHIAMRNLYTGALIGCIPVPAWDPCSDDPEETSRDLVTETFDAAYPNDPVRPFGRADDGSCGTFTMGPLIGLWEWLDFGEEPVERDQKWATWAYRQVQEAHQ